MSLQLSRNKSVLSHFGTSDAGEWHLLRQVTSKVISANDVALHTMNVGTKQQTAEGTGLYGQTTAKRYGCTERSINSRETYVIIIGHKIVGIEAKTCLEE